MDNDGKHDDSSVAGNFVYNVGLSFVISDTSNTFYTKNYHSFLSAYNEKLGNGAVKASSGNQNNAL